MIKTFLISFFLLCSSMAEAHTKCDTRMIYQPGYHSPYGEWITGRWVYGQKCWETHVAPRPTPVYTYHPRPWFQIRVSVPPTHRPNHRHHRPSRPHRPHRH